MKRYTAVAASWINISGLLLMSLLTTNTALAQDAAWNALTQGKFDFSARYRFELVDDKLAPGGIPLKEAKASTLRTTLGYKTAQLHGFDGRLLLQDVRAIGADSFNDGTVRPASKVQYATVADPSDTDYIEAYIGYSGLANTTVKVGRQLIAYGDAPFHRFIGTVPWRQNWQNHDAISITSTLLPDTTFNYAYSWNVNRIFTDMAVPSALANFDSNSHLVNIKYAGLPAAQLEAYTYLLDFENSRANSVASYGLRMSGGVPLKESIKGMYTAEYALQDDYGDNTANVDEYYVLGELQAVLQLNKPTDSVSLKLSYEQLSGNGVSAFQTPLATAHPYQGWTDRFVITPVNGIKDYYLTTIISAFGARFIAEYHDLNSDNLDYSYGEELDLMLTRTFFEHYTFGIKYGSYNADINAMNTVGGTATDVTKYWGWAEVRF